MLLFLCSFILGLVLGWFVLFPVLTRLEEKGWKLRTPWYKC